MNFPSRAHQAPTTADPMLVNYWYVLWRYRRIIGALWALTTIGAVALAFLATPTYRASATLVIRDQMSEPMGALAMAANLTGVKLGSGATAKQPVAGLTSKEITFRFIQQNSLKKELFPELWDQSRNQWLEEEPSMLAAFNRFDKEVRDVAIDYDANMATLSIIHTDPAKAAQWANELVALYNAEQRAKALKEGERRVAYITQQLQEITVIDIRRSLVDLVQGQLRSNIVAAGVEDFEFRVIDRAVPPEIPYSPNKTLYIALGFFGGLIFGSLLALFVHGWNQVLRAEYGE